MTRCPYCVREGPRAEIHAHLVDDHADAVNTWTDAASGQMRYAIECPACEEGYEHRVKPRMTDPAFLEEFAREIRLVGFDMLLNHMEAAHGPPVADDAAAAAGEPLPPAGPGGGRGRPGREGVPRPPGMPPPEPTALERIRNHRSIDVVKRPGRAEEGTDERDQGL